MTDRRVHTVGPKGQVVIPKGLREELGIRPGSSVTFELLEDAVVVRRVGEVDELRGMLAGEGGLLDELLADRRRDRRRGWRENAEADVG